MQSVWIVVMGVSGCGKSTLARPLADALGVPMIEGDQYHPPANIAKMSAGVALDDADRAGWLDALTEALIDAPQGAVLACSALKRAYRQRLRAGVPGLRFVFLALSQDEAMQRVAARTGHHMFPASLVADQFATLEPPVDEPLVLRVSAMASTLQTLQAVQQWLDGAAEGAAAIDRA